MTMTDIDDGRRMSRDERIIANADAQIEAARKRRSEARRRERNRKARERRAAERAERERRAAEDAAFMARLRSSVLVVGDTTIEDACGWVASHMRPAASPG